MNKSRIALGTAIIFFTLALTLPAIGQQNGIVVINAGAERELTFGMSQSLLDIIANVTSRFIIQSADDLKFRDLASFTGPTQVLPRIILLSAYTNRNITFNYPVDLIGDNLPPHITLDNISDDGFGNITIIWIADEFTDSFIQYGLEPGVYTDTYYDPLHNWRHEDTLSSILPFTTYYITISGTDRSGNTGESEEYSFTTSGYAFIYIPIILRD